MNPIGIVICNYNKSRFVVECIQSILESKEQNFDIYVVDNASTDDSVEQIKTRYGNQVTLIENTENLGGSGGFNSGLRIVRDKGYRYFMCLDDDAMVDENAIHTLYTYMEEHPDVGMAGCRVYHTQMPEYIQQCGLTIDFKHCTIQTLYADTLEDGSLPDVISCDAAATCALMVRGSVIRETNVGIMPEDNFIYWDDIEWGYRMHLAGYRTVTLGSAKALHQMGATTKKSNTFINYYMWRNRTNFFMRYTPEENLDEMSIHALGDIFDYMYESMFREEHNNVQTIAYALQDVLQGVRGKAAEYKLLPNDADDAVDERLTAYVQDKNTFFIVEDGYSEEAGFLRNFLQKANPALTETDQKNQADVIFHMCENVFRVQDFSLKEIYIDENRTCILSEEDVLTVKNYEYCKSLFLYMNQGVFLAAANNLRK
ncbi:MAG: glycosyltransferase family 2 protein [Lachnospiraceae bacterium]|nr:glycosyltransferase family 2 protein [Lachnospiraceae bacterium]